MSGVKSWFAAALVVAVMPQGLAQAQVPIRCSTFLHNRDGSWTSFWTGTVLASRGPVPIHTGERFRVGGNLAQTDVARILDGMCESD